MRQLAIGGVLWLFLAGVYASAQVQVSAQTQRSEFLLFERVDLLVTVENVGDTDLVLDNYDGQPWLSFLVSRHSQQNYLPVRPERPATFSPLTLKAGESKTLRVNLTPLFSFRQEGEYRANAVIDLPGQGQIISENTAFNVQKGQTVWSQAHMASGAQRVYSLVRFSPAGDRTLLYLRVESPTENLVYANIGLGEVAAFIDPEVFFDPQGNIHILHPFAMGNYLYTRADPDGKIEHQAVFRTYREIPPVLRKTDDGNVVVVGGLEENPNEPREKLSDGQIAKKSDSTPAGPDTMQ